MRTYGSYGVCGRCKRKNVKLHAKIKGVVLCMRDYSRVRYANPKKREAHKLAVRRWRERQQA